MISTPCEPPLMIFIRLDSESWQAEPTFGRIGWSISKNGEPPCRIPDLQAVYSLRAKSLRKRTTLPAYAQPSNSFSRFYRNNSRPKRKHEALAPAPCLGSDAWRRSVDGEKEESQQND